MRDPDRYKVLYMVKERFAGIEDLIIFNKTVSPKRAHRLARNYSKRHNIKVSYFYYDPATGKTPRGYHDMTGTK